MGLLSRSPSRNIREAKAGGATLRPFVFGGRCGKWRMDEVFAATLRSSPNDRGRLRPRAMRVVAAAIQPFGAIPSLGIAIHLTWG